MSKRRNILKEIFNNNGINLDKIDLNNVPINRVLIGKINLILKDSDLNLFYEKLSNKIGYKYINDIGYLKKSIFKQPYRVGVIPYEGLKKCKFLVLNKNQNIEVIIFDPFNYELIQYIKTMLDKYIPNKDIKYLIEQPTIEIKLTTLKNIKEILKILKKGENDDFDIKDYSDIGENDYNVNLARGGDLNIISFVRQIILKAYKDKASDIHLEPTENSFDIRFRIDGILVSDHIVGREFKDRVAREVISRIKILCDMDVAEKRKPQDGRIPNDQIIKGKKVPFDLRVSTFPTVHGEKVVLRILDKNALKPRLEDLGMPIKMLETFKNKINSPYGFILVTGPTGSGKTTTLYSALSNVDKNEKNILTVEDPVEYRLEGVHQMQVNEKIKLTFESGLRTILRQDPDVIMVGEIRDLETANMAVRAALTGHIVFSTLHTNDSIGVVIRLKNMGIDPFLIASALSLAVAQRLVRTICPYCKSEEGRSKNDLKKHLDEIGVNDNKLKSVGIDIENFSINEFPYGKGKNRQGEICHYCRGTGYRGRVGIFEFFEIDDDIRRLILDKDFNEDKLREKAKEKGMKFLNNSAIELIEDKVTTIEEIIRVVGES